MPSYYVYKMKLMNRSLLWRHMLWPFMYDSSLVGNGAQGKEEILKRWFQEFPFLPPRPLQLQVEEAGGRIWITQTHLFHIVILIFLILKPIFHIFLIFFVCNCLDFSEFTLLPPRLQLQVLEAGGRKPSHSDLENPSSTPHLFPRFNFFAFVCKF